jgi:hypothetical protein
MRASTYIHILPIKEIQMAFCTTSVGGIKCIQNRVRNIGVAYFPCGIEGAL